MLSVKVSLQTLIGHLKDYKQHSNGKIFSATFIKKDGTQRTITCRFDVKSHLKGGELKYNPEEKGLLIVYDMQKLGYRSISLNKLLSANLHGITYKVVQ